MHEDQVEEEFPAPSNPMAVARRLMPAWQIDGHRTLRHWRGSWMRWHGTHWTEVEDQGIRSKAYRRLEHATYLYVNAKGDSSTKLWAPSKRKVADLLDALSAITHLNADVDAPAWIDGAHDDTGGPIVACTNGLLRVADRRLLDLNPRFFNLVSVPFDYHPDAAEPKRWLEFLDQLWPEDPDTIEALQEFFGYVLSGRTDLQKILLMIGPTRSGKGTIARVLGALVGKGNVAGPTLASLATNFGMASLLGKPLAIVSDARLGGRENHLVVERLLTISGEDTIDVDRKYKQAWTGRIPARFMILSNELPNFGDASGTIAHRFIVLMMTRSWLHNENTGLTKELTQELPGILNWALDGLARLAKQGRFTEPSSSIDAVTTMKDTASPMSAFVRECCETGPAHEVSVDAMYAAWNTWCDVNGRDKPGNKQMFGRNLRATVPQVRPRQPRVNGVQMRGYAGIALKPAQDWTHNAPDRVSPRVSPDYDPRDTR